MFCVWETLSESWLILGGVIATSKHSNLRIPEMCKCIIYKPPPNILNINNIKFDN